MGPLEYVEIGFEGNRFTGEILPQVRALQQKGIIRLVDLLFVKKDEQGNVQSNEVDDLGEEVASAYEDLTRDLQGLFTAEDIQMIAADLPVNSSAAIALFEHTWAVDLKEAIARANGVILAGGFVGRDMLDMLNAELEATKSVAR